MKSIYPSLSLILLTSVSMLLISCSTIKAPSLQSREPSYLTATSIAPLKIPPGISAPAFEDRYPVPPRQQEPISKDISLLPPGL